MAVTYTIAGGLVHASGNPIEITLTASAALENHKLLLRVACKSMLDVAMQGSPFLEEIAPNAALKATFDISGLADYPTSHTFDYPVIGASSPHDLLAIKVTFEVGECWTDANGDYQESFVPAAETIRVISGKLRQHELALLNEAGKSFASEYIEGGKFLTHQPDYLKVGPSQLCMLWYLGRWANENHNYYMNLKVITNLKEFILSEPRVYWSITGLTEFDFSVWHLNGYAQMTAGEKHLAYDFWLSDNADGTAEVSEHRHYVIDWAHYEDETIVYALNPLSGIDMHRFTGATKEGLATEAETAVRPVPLGSGTHVPSVKTISVKGRRTWEINTGWREKAEMLALRDLLESKSVWIVDKTINRLVPVVVESGEFSLHDSMDDIHNLAIKFTEAHNG